MVFRCNQCHEVSREFFTAEELARHNELRHGGYSYSPYGKQEPKVKRPSPAGKSWEEIWAAMRWDADLLEDEIQELTAKRNRIEDLMASIEQAGNLDPNGKAPKAKTPNTKEIAKKKPAKKPVDKYTPSKAVAKKVAQTVKSKPKPAAVAKVETSKVGLPPSQGGTPPPGKQFWNARSGRWSATKPATEPRSHEATKPRAKGKSAREIDRETRDLDSGDAFEADGFTPNASLVDESPDPAVIDHGAPDAELRVDVPIGWVMEHVKSNADMRWRNNRVEGATDEEIEQRINYELGEKGEMRGPDWHAAWKRVKGVTTLTVTLAGAAPLSFAGRELVDKVREVLAIDVRYGTPGEVAEQVRRSKKAV